MSSHIDMQPTPISAIPNLSLTLSFSPHGQCMPTVCRELYLYRLWCSRRPSSSFSY